MYDRHPIMPSAPSTNITQSLLRTNDLTYNLGDKLHSSAIALQKLAGNAKMAYDAGMQLYGIGKAVAPLIAPLLVYFSSPSYR